MFPPPLLIPKIILFFFIQNKMVKNADGDVFISKTIDTKA